MVLGTPVAVSSRQIAFYSEIGPFNIESNVIVETNMQRSNGNEHALFLPLFGYFCFAFFSSDNLLFNRWVRARKRQSSCQSGVSVSWDKSFHQHFYYQRDSIQSLIGILINN